VPCPARVSCARTHGLDVPMLGEMICLSHTKESYQRRCVTLAWETGVLRAISLGQLLAGAPCGGNSESSSDGGHVGAGV